MAKAAKSAAGITSLHYRLSGTVPAKGLLTADASMTAQPPAMSMDLNTAVSQGGGGQLRIRFTNKTMYVGGSAIHSEKLKGKHWLSAAPAVWGQGATDNQSYRVLPSQLQANPASQSTLLTGSKDLQTVGTETVDGVPTTHYKGTVNYDALRGERLDQYMQLEASGPLTMDLWIDSKNRPKQYRLQAKHPTDPLPSGADTPLDLTVTFLDINQPTTIKAPPAGDTAPLADHTQR
ncbi:LppX_LprAFG lipoprotein [Streptomyces sp. B21-101]|uniref:LppX_LprAFG lipoprotein n=1 Tax=Streptomyces sp. B21-101 TaxID=3039415 RepID=UPI002FF1CFE9